MNHPGRPTVWGSNHPAAKLNDDKVRAILRLSKEGWKGKDLARRFYCSPTTISMVLNGKQWKHVQEEEAEVGAN